MTCRNLIPLMGDQLSWDLDPLKLGDPTKDQLILMEVGSEAKAVSHHPQKIAMIFSAMRHFAEEARSKNWTVTYVRYRPQSSFLDELENHCKLLKPNEIHVTRASEWRVYLEQKTWAEHLSTPVKIYEDTRFFSTIEQFTEWASDRKEWRMEYFYRALRRQSGILMDGNEPIGGQWNFDKQNRKPIPKNVVPPRRRKFAPDRITRAVLSLVEEHFSSNFGDIAKFNWPVNRAEALEALDHFISDCLPLYGDYQDAMRNGFRDEDDTLFHSLIAPALNIGLLSPLEVCQAAELAYHNGKCPINASEGFIRQILGWREYVRGLYWHMGPGYRQLNFLEAEADLPSSYWGAHTNMLCIAEVVRTTRQNAYAHHIQRLMITGNFALLLGVNPLQVNEWYLSVYADAFEWVQLPNTHGMALYADGGRLASKPYAASGAYVNRMSDYCKTCSYAVKDTVGEEACPLNALYWDFISRHKGAFSKNPRMGLAMKNWDRKCNSDKASILEKAARLKLNADSL